AERLDCFGESETMNSPAPDVLFVFPVFKLLMGLSFENLLKGIVTTQRGNAGSSGKLDKDLGAHRMSKLLDLLDPAVISVSKEEKVVLEELEGYVTWAGRYPFPKRPEELFAKQHSSQAHRLVESLWHRLHNHLKGNAWVVKMCGTKLPT